MSNLLTHARNEFRAAKWINDNGEYCDEMQGMICDHVLKLLEVFSNEGHSGSSAPYAVNVFQKLAMYEPLVPLTGEDWEWTLLDYGVYPTWQNKRCSRVFKDADGVAYDIDGIVFYDWFEDENHERHKSHYTCRESRVNVTFPYTPTTVYKERETPEQMGS
jgi:hypothetical protein